MAVDEDQTNWVARPPPPRPQRREAAIEAALRKFDGVEEAAPETRATPSRGWAQSFQPRLAVAMSVALLLVIFIPATMIGRHDTRPTPRAAPPDVAVESNVAPPQARIVETAAPPPPGRTAPADINSPAVPAPRRAAPAPPPAVTTQSPPVAEAAPQTRAANEPASAPAFAPAPPPPPPPPPPPAPAREIADEAAAAGQELVVTGSRARAPQMQSNALAAAKASDARVPATAAYGDFLERLQAAARTGDRRAMIAQINFPLRVTAGGETRFYRDAASVEQDFDRIFTPRVTRAILRQKPAKLRLRGGAATVGAGELSISATCADAECLKATRVGIAAVNP